MVTTLCYLLECLLNPTNTPPDCNKELYELYFVFAAVWAFGGAMFQDQVRIYEDLSKVALVRVATVQEMARQGKVKFLKEKREKSGNFVLSQGKLTF